MISVPAPVGTHPSPIRQLGFKKTYTVPFYWSSHIGLGFTAQLPVFPINGSPDPKGYPLPLPSQIGVGFRGVIPDHPRLARI
jgi:hypothetical protein